MGLVFQNYALWPHLTVRRNVEFGLRVQKVPAAERKTRVDAALDMMQIGQASERYPPNCPAASSSGSPWPGCSRSTCRSCCSTSRCRTSTPRSGWR